jgi:hypothetical protein
MLQSVDRIDAFAPIEFQQFAQQRQCLRTEFAEDMSERRLLRVPLVDAVAARQLAPARHSFIRWRADQVENQVSLVQIRVSGQDGLLFEHFAKDTTHTPQIHGSRVFAQLKQQLGWAIPSRDNQGGIFSCGFTSSAPWSRRIVFVGTGQPEIGNLQYPSVVDEQVCCLHVAVQDLVGVQVRTPFKKLLHIAFDLRLREMYIWIFEETGQVMIHVRCDHEHRGFLARVLGSFHRHFFQLEDVEVVKLLQQLDLPKSSDGKAIFLIVHQDLLEGHNLSRLF